MQWNWNCSMLEWLVLQEISVTETCLVYRGERQWLVLQPAQGKPQPLYYRFYIIYENQGMMGYGHWSSLQPENWLSRLKIIAWCLKYNAASILGFFLYQLEKSYHSSQHSLKTNMLLNAWRTYIISWCKRDELVLVNIVKETAFNNILLTITSILTQRLVHKSKMDSFEIFFAHPRLTESFRDCQKALVSEFCT